jgi:hypothetical protein
MYRIVWRNRKTGKVTYGLPVYGNEPDVRNAVAILQTRYKSKKFWWEKC